MSREGLDDPRWCTFNQARDAGWHVRRGERALATVEFWSWYVRLPEGGGVVTLQRAEQLARAGRIPEEALGGAFLRGKLHHVFNASQVDGIGPYDPSAHAPSSPEVERVADELIECFQVPGARGTRRRGVLPPLHGHDHAAIAAAVHLDGRVREDPAA